MPRDPEKLLSELELAAWRGFLRVHTQVTKAMSAELEERYRLTLSEYEVMLKVAISEDGSPRLTDIAEQVLITASGLTRLIDRLQQRGLVERGVAGSDGRARTLTLTPAGAALFAEARQTHLTGIRSQFLAHLSTAEQKQLAEFWNRMLCHEV